MIHGFAGKVQLPEINSNFDISLENELSHDYQNTLIF